MKKWSLLLLFFILFSKVRAQAVTVNPRSSLIMHGSVFLVVKNAALVNNSIISDDRGTVQFNGSKDSSFSFLSGSQVTTLYNLTVDKTAFGTSIKSPVAVRNVLGVYNGTLYAAGNLTLRSDNNLTARVDVVPPSANIAGKAIVERYFPAKRSWRLITAPLTNTPSIFNSWQNSGAYTPAANTCISGPNPTGAGGNGLDPSIQNNASMKIWDYPSQSLLPVLNTHVPLSPGTAGTADNVGYFLFVRGDRSFSNFYLPNTNITTLSSNGQLQVGTQNFPASAVSGGLTLIGNPFASPVDFNLIGRNNLVKRFYVWDPSLNAVGGYVMLDDLDNDGIYTKSVNSSAQNKHIQSSQAFFVETLSTGAAGISFLETCKSAGNNNTLFRPQQPAQLPNQTIRILLNMPQADSSVILADEVLLECNADYSDSVDLDDALKLTNINENIGLVRSTTVLTAERRSLLSPGDTLFLKLSRTAQKQYAFQIIPEAINDHSLLAWLEDSYLNNSTLISLTDASTYVFNVDGNTASAAPNRFRIVFKQALLLPVTIVTIAAFRQNQNNTVEWEVANESNIVQYEIERATDGNHFSTIGIIAAAANGNPQQQYQFLDQQPVNGTNFYRIKYTDLDGHNKYSSIVKVKITRGDVIVYPNPVRDNIMHLQLNNYPPGKYYVRIMNQAGQMIYEQAIQTNSSAVTCIIRPSLYLMPAVYDLQIIDDNNQITIKKIIVSR